MATVKTPKQSATSNPVVNWFAGGVAVIGLLHFLFAFSPSVWTWGIDYWSELPLWVRSLCMLLLAAAVFPGFAERIDALFKRIPTRRGIGWIAASAALVLFIVFRSRGYSYGDGYSFSGYFASGGMPDITGNLALMAGDIVTHWGVYRGIVEPLGGSVELSYSVVSALAGIVSLSAIARMAGRLFPKDRGARWAFIGAGFSSGMAVMWFGHVESYSLMGAALLWSIAFMIEGALAKAAVMWVLACVMHLMAVAFLPVIVWAWLGKRLLPSPSRGKVLILVLVGFVGWGVAGILFGIFKPGIFVPIVAGGGTSYGAFSVSHLSDALNLALFVAPLGLLGLTGWLFRGEPERQRAEDTAAGILAVASSSLWFFSFWVDPLIGAFRDWDLIGAYGIPFSLLGVLLILRYVAAQPGPRPQWVIIAVFALANSGAFVMTIQTESQAMERVDRLVGEDVHYSRDFYRGERLMSWSYILNHLLGERERAVVHMTNRATWEPNDLTSWSNLGSVYWHLGKFDSAASSFERAIALDPNDPKLYQELAIAYSSAQDWDKVIVTLVHMAELHELAVGDLNLLAFGYLSRNQLQQADSTLGLSISRFPDQQEAFYYRAIILERQGDTTGALANYEQAMVPSTNVEDVYMRCVRLYQAKLRWADAERVATMWQAEFPNSAGAPFVMGICRVAAKQYESARDALERAAALDPKSAITQYYLATVYRNLGMPERALATAQQASRVDPQLALPYLEMVYLAADRADRAAAVVATREYLRRAPSDSGMSYLQQFMEP